VQKGYQLSPADVQKLLGVYNQRGDFQSMALLYEQLVLTQPDKTDYWIQLAVLYARLGRVKAAEIATRHAMELDASPQFQAEAAAFLKSIGVTP
jgi:Flp pilus assembly protein TadD